MGKKKHADHPHMKHLERIAELSAIVDDETAKPKARKAAKAELKTLRAEGEARIAAADEKRGKGKARPASEAPVDADEDAAAQRKAEREQSVEEIDANIKARLAEKAKPAAEARKGRLQKLQADVAEERAERHPEIPEVSAPRGGTSLPEIEIPAPDTAALDAAEAEIREAAKAAAKVTPEAPAVESDPFDFAKPSEAPKVDFETNGNNQYIVQRPSDGKLVGYTRVTTYIGALEDTTKLTEWKLRVLLEGVAAAESEAVVTRDESPLARVLDLAHQRDLAIAKARKRDRKGKLEPGQLAVITDGAWGDFKRAMNALTEELFEIGGGREKAQKGTDLHALTDIVDMGGGMAVINDMLEAEEISPADYADMEAYAEGIKRMGLRLHVGEQVIVNDDLKVAGRLDRVWIGKLPEIRHPKTGEVIRPADTRARRYVGDLKTGNVEYGIGKIAQQLRMYAEAETYDLNTHERGKHGANRDVGLLMHLPAGSAKMRVHIVNLGIGSQGIKLSGEVRSFRNTGKRAADFSIDVLAQLDAAEQAAADAAAPAEESTP